MQSSPTSNQNWIIMIQTLKSDELEGPVKWYCSENIHCMYSRTVQEASWILELKY